MAAVLLSQRELGKLLVGIAFYDGTEVGPSRLREFLADVETAWLVSGLPLDEPVGVKAASMRLTGAAKSWFLGLAAAAPESYGTFRAAITARFQAPDAAPVAALALVGMPGPASTSLTAVTAFCSAWQRNL